MSRNSDIGLSRRQKVFVTLEDTVGTLKFPNATTDFIRPAGNAVMNQQPATVNSEELADSLDILEQFQNATPAGEWTIKMYIRPSGTLRSAPQGATLFRSLQGLINPATTLALAGSIATTATASMIVSSISGGVLPKKGVIKVGSEQIYYNGKTQAGATAATLTSLTRGYASTTAANHATAATGSLSSIFYRQYQTSESFSVWIETDHFVQAMSGCAINTATIEITNDGGLLITFEGGGMQMKWAGTTTLAAAAATAATQITVTYGKLYCASMYLYNYTKGSGGMLINASNATTGVLRLNSGLAANWASGDTIKGYLPTGTPIGEALAAKHSEIKLNNVQTNMKGCTLNIGTPKQYLIDEIGTEYPEDYLENVRDINTTVTLYFRKADARYFKDGADPNIKTPVQIIFGNEHGSIMDVYMPACRFSVPSIEFAPPAIELSIPVTALGTSGEDSMEITFR